MVKVGLSYTGMDGARKNLADETGDGYDFDATRSALHDTWQRQLTSVQVAGGTEERQQAFYTALYHAQLHPNLAGDTDGRYIGFDGKAHTASGYTPYQNLSLWDTYRPQNQLLEMLEPGWRATSRCRSSRSAGTAAGCPLGAGQQRDQHHDGRPGDPVPGGGVVQGPAEGVRGRGIRAAEEERDRHPARRLAVQRPLRHGLLPRPRLHPSGLELGQDCADKGGDNDCAHPASASLEYSAADASLALMARGLGHHADARKFAERGQWYRKLWDSSIGQFRPRTTDGDWVTPYDPVEADHQFHEGGAYQYQWLVPQDPAGLVELMGGRRSTEQRLDDFFAYDDLLTDPAGTAREKWISAPTTTTASRPTTPTTSPTCTPRTCTCGRARPRRRRP
ncbi:glycoside hydrolase domain-containing protein [Streptomyces sp. M19]